MRRLLDDFSLTFDLSYRVGGRTLEDQICDLIDRIEAGSSPDWGTSGAKEEILSYESRQLKFYYLPHLFPGMDQKLRLAHKLQFGLLPTDLPEDSILSLSAVMESYCHLSGDLFGWEGLANGDFFLWIFDVSGHGVRSGTASAVIKTLIDAEPERNDPAALLANLNEALCNCLRSHVSSFFATGVFMRIRRDGSVLYASAGHQPFLVRRESGGVDTFESTGMPIGMLREATWESLPLELAPQDIFLLFTDGLTDLADDFDRHFGLDRVTDFLRGELERPGALTASLYETLSNYCNLDFLSDDIAFVAGKVNA
jgi:sigma-B regulation protein RsbU (phosphoserine phosphatase)